MIWLKKWPPHFKEVEVTDGGDDDIEVIFENGSGVGIRHC